MRTLFLLLRLGLLWVDLLLWLLGRRRCALLTFVTGSGLAGLLGAGSLFSLARSRGLLFTGGSLRGRQLELSAGLGSLSRLEKNRARLV